MKSEWAQYDPVPQPPLLKNLRWDRVVALPWSGLQGFYKWLFAGQQKLTPAQVSNYTQCPQKYKYTRIDRRPTKPSPHLAFYQALHKSLIDFHRRLQADPAATMDDLLKVYQQFWDPDPFADEPQEKLFYENGLAVLERVFAQQHGQKPPDELREEVEVHIDGIPLKLTVDTIHKTDPKNWIITIYKTGARVLQGSALMNDLKSQLVYLVLHKRWPKINLTIRYHFLQADLMVPINMRPDEQAAARRHLHEANRGLSENDYPTHPSPLCGWCDFQAECPNWNGYVTDKTMYRLSYSKMMTYVRCPRNFKALYHDRIAPQPRSFFSIGTSFHNTMEDVFNYEGVFKQPSFEHTMKFLRKQWVNAGYENEAEEKEYFRDCVTQLRDYYLMEVNGKYKKAFSTEPYFELPIGDHFVMIGFIDRIEAHEDGTYEVIDYKTEPKMRTQEEVDSDLQLTVYYWACIVAFGFEPKKLTLHFTRHNKKISTTRTKADIDKLIAYVNEVGGRMRTETKFDPLVNKYCSSCDHLRGCPKEAEVLAEAKAGHTMHKIKVEETPAAAVPAALIDDEEKGQQETDVEKNLKRLPSEPPPPKA
jgi:putative RecB family exonuclease